MLDEYLKRDDVLNFIKEIKHNERYFQKEKSRFENYSICISDELALYIFYNAIFLYKIIVDDVYLFDEYIEQLEKIYKKINSCDDLMEGIHKLIGKMVVTKLKISDITNTISREKVISYIFDKYVINGYFIHGFNTSYTESIMSNGFMPGNYFNYYSEFNQVNDIFNKYHEGCIIEKDFSDFKVTFTDDFIMGCYYSTYAPMYFSNFLSNEEYFGKRNRQDGYLIDDYSLATYGLKRFTNFNMFDGRDREFVFNLVKKEWDLLHRCDKKISLLLVKRAFLNHKELNISDYLNDDNDLYDVIDRLISSDYHNISCRKEITKDNFIIVDLDLYYEKEEEVPLTPEEELYQYKELEVGKDFLNVYGKISVFLLVGGLLIITGVLLTIFMILRGM